MASFTTPWGPFTSSSLRVQPACATQSMACRACRTAASSGPPRSDRVHTSPTRSASHAPVPNTNAVLDLAAGAAVVEELRGVGVLHPAIQAVRPRANNPARVTEIRVRFIGLSW